MMGHVERRDGRASWTRHGSKYRPCATIFGHLTNNGHLKVQFRVEITSNLVTSWLSGRAADAPGIGHHGLLF